MPTITSLQPRTQKILNQFFDGIKDFRLTNINEQIKLLDHTKKFFNDLEKLDIKEFAKIFKYDYFSSTKKEDHKKYQKALNFLVACIIEKYSQSDLLNYFLSGDLSQKENSPEYSGNVSRIVHWVQLLGNWLSQLFNKPKFEFTMTNSELSNSIEQLKTLLNKDTYFDNSFNNDFNRHLAVLREKIQEKISYSGRNEINLAKKLRAFAKDLDAKALSLDERDKELNNKEAELTTREEDVIKNERINKEVAELYREERQAVHDNLILLRAKKEVENKELTPVKKELDNTKEKLKTLKKENVALEAQLNEINNHQASLINLGSDKNGVAYAYLTLFLEKQLDLKNAEIYALKKSLNENEAVTHTDLILLSDSDDDSLLAASGHENFSLKVEASTSQQSTPKNTRNSFNESGFFNKSTSVVRLERQPLLNDEAKEYLEQMRSHSNV